MGKNGWNAETIILLEKLRRNSIYLSETISLISCVVGLIVSIITSIKLYLNISDAMTNELKMSKDFYTLGIEVYRVLSMHQKHRTTGAVEDMNTRTSH